MMKLVTIALVITVITLGWYLVNAHHENATLVAQVQSLTPVVPPPPPPIRHEYVAWNRTRGVYIFAAEAFSDSLESFIGNHPELRVVTVSPYEQTWLVPNERASSYSVSPVVTSFLVVTESRNAK